MNRFAIAKPKSFTEAATMVREPGGSYALPVIKAGGLDVIDHLKEGLMEPDLLIDVRPLQSDATKGGGIAAGDGRVMFDATTTLAELADSTLVSNNATALARAAGDAATPQVRNVATAAGNLLQRPRCWYYRQEQFDCIKKGGDTCYAKNGENQYHAIFATDRSPCVIVHPSNIAIALMVLDGRVHLTGSDRDSVALADLYHLPNADVSSEHNLQPGEVITHISCAIEANRASSFYAIKHKQSFDWPLAAAAVSLQLEGSRIRDARVCAGAVAPVPWPMLDVAAALNGVNIDDDAALRKACDTAAVGARPLEHNGYKVQLLKTAIRRAVRTAAGRDAVA